MTELVDGVTLRIRLEGGALPSRRAVAYAIQIAKGMAAAHARGIVHRDLKPENVMITRDDQVNDQPRNHPLRRGSDARRHAIRARHAEQHPRAQRCVGRWKTVGVFQHRRAPGRHFHRLARRAHAARHRRRTTGPCGDVHSRRAIDACLLTRRHDRRQVLQPNRLVTGSDNGLPSGIGLYDIEAQTTTTIGGDEAPGVAWLADSRRLVYFTKDGWELVILDVATRQRTIVDVRLPGPSTNEIFAMSPDNRTIYYGAARAEADIWIAERK